MRKPMLLLLLGLPGVGKTTLANCLANRVRSVVISTEDIRAALLGRQSEPDDCDFSAEDQDLTYRTMALICRYLLMSNISVIADGVFRSVQQRALFAAEARRVEATLLCLHVTCDEQIVAERLQARKRSGTTSPAGHRTYWKVKEEFEPLSHGTDSVDTSPGIDRLDIDSIVRVLNTASQGPDDATDV